LKVNGIGQIPQEAEFANSTLVKRVKDFFLIATVYLPKENKIFPEKSVGVDFGIKNTLTLSTGETFKIDFPESRRIRKLRQKLSRKKGSKKGQKKSKSYYRNLDLVNANIEKTNNQKKDKRNKIVSYIVNKFETVCIQNDNVKGWQKGLFGKQVHSSAIGGIKRDLINKSHTPKIVDRYAPTTKLCRNCFKINEMKLEDRVYVCSCGYVEERDKHSALSIEDIGLGRVFNQNGNWKRIGDQTISFPMEHMELKILVEDEAAAICFANDEFAEQIVSRFR